MDRERPDHCRQHTVSGFVLVWARPSAVLSTRRAGRSRRRGPPPPRFYVSGQPVPHAVSDFGATVAGSQLAPPRSSRVVVLWSCTNIRSTPLTTSPKTASAV